jgi:predicted TIM-barrel fold metal-dependent hydrolase
MTTKIVDVHRHLWDVGWFPPTHLRQTAEANAYSVYPPKNVDEVLERIKRAPTMDPTCDGAMQEQEKYGIDVGIIQTLDWGLAYGPEEDAPVPVEEFNRITLRNAAKYKGRLYAMAGIDPRRPRAVKLFEEMVVEHGAVGLKVYPPCGFQPNDEICWPMYKKAIELDVPVLIHTGGAGKSSRTRWTWPEWVEEVAVMFPELRVVMGHTNLQGPFETGAYWRGLTAARSKPNIYLDLCDWQVLGAVKDENIPELLRVMRVFLDTVGPYRIVWGTDLPQTGVGRRRQHETQLWTDIFKNLPEWGDKYGIRFTEEERDGICHLAAMRCFSNIDWSETPLADVQRR